MLTLLRLFATGLLLTCFLGISPLVFAQNSALQSIAEEIKLSRNRAKRDAPTGAIIMEDRYVGRFDAAQGPQQNRMRDPFDHTEDGVTPEFDQGIRSAPEFSTAFATPTQMQTQQQRFKAELQSDARLYDVCFVNAQTGFAVGDHGTIWKTVDGGRNWTLTDTPVDCSLHSVSFGDPMRGVAVGGFRIPYLNKTEGVILQTNDGGESWVRVPTPFVPLLRRVKMENRSNGWAAGDSSNMSQGGLFQTDDGGRTWYAMPGADTIGWTDFHFSDPQTGAGLASDGSLRIMQGVIQYANHFPLGQRRPTALDLFDHAIPGVANGWLVGEGGLVYNSIDHGENWQPVQTLPLQFGSLFDLQAVFARENNVWIAGSPGTIIYYSKDAGKSWNAASTGITTPIREIRFFDPMRGYAVGDLGVILETLDGGVNWSVQRLGGARLAMLGVYMKSGEIPLESLVLYGKENGYLCGVNIVSQSDENSIDAVHEAVVRSGGVSATQSWGFTLDDAELNMPIAKVVERIDRENDGKGLLRFRQNLVRNIRMWRPNVMTTSDPREGDAASRHFLARELADAIRAAADPDIFPEQIRQAGLTPWKTAKLYLVSREFQGEINVESGDYAVRIGRSPDESTFGARGLIQPNPSQWFSRAGYQSVLNDFANAASTKGDLMSGITIAPGLEARRIPLGNAADQAEMKRRTVQQRRQILRLCETMPQNQVPDSQFNTIAMLETLLQDMNPVQIPELLLEAGLRFREQNRWSDAEAVFMQLAEQFPQHPYTLVALQWLIQYNVSGEIRWWMKRKEELDEQNPVDPLDRGRRELLRTESVKQFSQQLKLYGPEEFNAMQRKSNASLVMIPATKAEHPPYLDGLFDEELDRGFWHDARIVSFTPKPMTPPQTGPIVLVSGQKPIESDGSVDLGTQAMFRYDDDNLYMAFRCRKSNGFAYLPPDDSPRPRDPDLSKEDRIEILLDIDGDAAVCFKLSVDYRGWVADECWGDKSWNPAWYVAREEDDQFWMIEAAIPLDQLTELPPQPDTAWGISLRRIVPAVGIENCATGPVQLRFE